MEHHLPIYPGRKLIKQAPRRFVPEVVLKIKEEMEKLLRSKCIKTTRYVDLLSNIVPIIKKNGTLRVYIDFRDLKDEYPMPVADMLVDSAVGNKVISLNFRWLFRV